MSYHENSLMSKFQYLMSSSWQFVVLNAIVRHFMRLAIKHLPLIITIRMYIEFNNFNNTCQYAYIAMHIRN